MGELARRVAEGPCVHGGPICVVGGGAVKHPECAVAAFKAWLQEKEDRVHRTMYAADVCGSYHGAHVAIAALVSALEEGE